MGQRPDTPTGPLSPVPQVGDTRVPIDGVPGAANDAWTLELTGPERAYLQRSLAALTAREREVVFAICTGAR